MSFTGSTLAGIHEQCVVHHCKTADGCMKSISKEGASFSLGGSPAPHLLADFDKPPLYDANRTRCDFLFVADGGSGSSRGWLALIEMTSGKKGVGEASRQLRAGSELITDLMPQDFSIKFRVVLVGRMSKHERRGLGKAEYRVRFRGSQPQAVKVIANKGKLADALTAD